MKQLGQSAVGTGAGTMVYRVPTGYRAIINDIAIANTTAGTLSFALHIVPSGGSKSASNMMFPDIGIAANTLVQWSGNQAMTAGSFIQCVGSGAGITVTVTGEEMR